MRTFINTMKVMALAIVTACAAAPVSAWEVADMNDHIEQTNFIVADHCSGTLISVEHRLILTNEHCVGMFVNKERREVVDEDGFVNDKMVEVRKQVPVSQKVYDRHKLVSQSSYISEIVDFDTNIDLAILQLRQETLNKSREAELFTGDRVFRGETAYAIGNPMMLDASVTKGVISNVNRLLRVGGEERAYFQMDAGIVGGSSGGSLYNSSGQLIGVPAAAARGTSVGLAIPYYVVNDFLARNCYQELWDEEAESYEDCMAEDEEEVEDEE